MHSSTKNDLKILLFVALNNDLFTPNIIIPDAPTAGDNFNITCRLDGVVERLVGTPTVILSFNNPPGGVSGDQSRDGLSYIRSRLFNPGKTDDVGTYTCVAVVIPSSGGFFGAASSSGTLQIQSNVTIYFISTVIVLTCSCISSSSSAHPHHHTLHHSTV